MKRFIVFLSIISCFLYGCNTLKPTLVTLKSPINDYQYVYITPTSEKNSIEGAAIGGYYGIYGIYGTTTSRSANPMDIISGHFINKGFIRVPEIKPEDADKTLIVNYGEIKSGYYVELSHGFSVVIQMVSASNNEIVCTCNGEGKGTNDVEAMINAIDRCLDEFFKQIKK